HNTRSGSIETHDANTPAVTLNIHDLAAGTFRPPVIAADTQARLENDGLITASQTAVLGGPGDETVINHGRIVGDVVLGDGADTFVFGQGGTLVGNLLLGAGDDLVRIEHGSGTSRVADFTAGPASGDTVDVSQFFSSFGALIAHSHQSGND